MPRTPSGTPIDRERRRSPRPAAARRASSAQLERDHAHRLPGGAAEQADRGQLARRSPVAIAAVLTSASAANSTDRPTISHTPHASRCSAACSVREVLRARQRARRPGARRRTARASARPPARRRRTRRRRPRRRVAAGDGRSRARRRRARPSGRRPPRRAASRRRVSAIRACERVADPQVPLGGDHVAHRHGRRRARRPARPRVTRRSSARPASRAASPAAGHGVSQPRPSSSRNTSVGSMPGGRVDARQAAELARRAGGQRRAVAPDHDVVGRDARGGDPLDLLLRARLQRRPGCRRASRSARSGWRAPPCASGSRRGSCSRAARARRGAATAARARRPAGRAASGRAAPCPSRAGCPPRIEKASAASPEKMHRHRAAAARGRAPR